MKSKTVWLALSGLLTLAVEPLSADEFNHPDLVQKVNLVGGKTSRGEWVDPRGLLAVKGPQLGLSQQEMDRMRQTIGDVVCPGVQGTGFLIGRGDEIITNAHLFVDENGRDRPNLLQCFWQNKEVPFRRVPLKVGVSTLKLFTRSTVEEFNLDLAVVRLDGTLPDVQPFRLNTAAPAKAGDRLIMVSASQLRMPSLPKPSTEFIRVASGTAFEFDYYNDPIVQGCQVRGIGQITYARPDDTIYDDCSATRGASGSPVLSRTLDGELTIKGVHVGGGQDAADYTDFSLEAASPGGRSYSNAIQLNRDIIGQIEQFERESQAVWRQ